MDLLGRKLGLNKGQDFKNLIEEIRQVIENAKGAAGLEDLAADMQAGVEKLEEAALHIGKTARSEEMMTAFAHAYSFMDVTGDVVMAWMLLWRGVVAAGKLAGKPKKKDKNKKSAKKSKKSNKKKSSNKSKKKK